MSDSAQTVPLRRLSDRESPMPGLLIAGSPPTVWTDAALWEAHPAWRADPGGHLLAPLDAGYENGAAGVAVAYCPDRLRTVLDRTLELARGEIVTLAVSLLRGVAEADALGIDNGTWWLTADGRPVGAAGDGPRLRDEAIALLGELVRDVDGPLSRAVEEARAVLPDPRRLRQSRHDVERSLFAAAEAAPLALMQTSVRARAVVAPLRAESASHDTPSEQDTPVPEPGSLVHEFVLRLVDAEWADRVTSALRGMGAALRPRRPAHTRVDPTPSRPSSSGTQAPVGSPRRRRVLVASAAGAAVLALGLVWPTASAEEPQGHAEASAASSPPRPVSGVGDSADAAPSPRPPSGATTQTPTASPPAAGEEEGDLPSAAAELLDRFAACAASGCGPDIVEDPSRPLPHADLTVPAREHVTLIDRYGGVAVIEVGAGGRSVIVVIVEADEKWLIRDVYDVADQPG